jgi:hypothetical protein
MSFLQRSVPVLLEIEFTGKSTEIGRGTSGEPFRETKRVARYTFTNWTSSPVKLAFPPARSFQFNRGVMQAEKAPPAFASKAFILSLAPCESQSFSEPYSLAPAAGDFWRGSPGLSSMSRAPVRETTTASARSSDGTRRQSKNRKGGGRRFYLKGPGLVFFRIDSRPFNFICPLSVPVYCRRSSV